MRRFAYDDATGKPVAVRGKITIGVGRNLVDTGLSADEIGYLPRATTHCGVPWQTSPYAVVHGQAVPEVKFDQRVSG